MVFKRYDHIQQIITVMIRNRLIPVSVLALFTSCFNASLPETEPRIVPDQEVIELPAEFTHADDTTVSISVKSNRSWFAHLNDVNNPIDPSDSDAKIGWATVDVDDHENLTKVDDVVIINLNVLRNKTTIERNGSLNFFYGGDVFVSLPIVQAAAVYYLQAVPESTSVLCTPDEISVSVKSNTSWTAELLNTSTASATLSKSDGVDSDEVIISFDENFELVDKKAFIKFSAIGCEDMIVEITQSRAFPYLILDEERTRTTIPADQEEATIYLKTNIEGITSTIDGELTDAVIEKISDKEFKVMFTSDGVDPVIYKKSTITFSAPEVDDVKVELKQNGLLVFDFQNVQNISPAIPMSSSNTVSNHNITVLGNNDYEFSINTFYHVVSNGVLLFKAGGYMIFPSIEGLTLKKITFTFRGHSSNKGVRFTIKGVGDKEDVLYSPSNVEFSIPATNKEYVTYSMNVGTEENPSQVGASYRICQGANKNCNVRYISLQYE